MIKQSLFVKERRSLIEKSLLLDNSIESYVKTFSSIKQVLRDENSPWAHEPSVRSESFTDMMGKTESYGKLATKYTHGMDDNDDIK